MPAAPCRPSSTRWTKALGHADQRPVIAIIGGAKVSTKIDLLENLVTKVDALVIGGGMANTFLHAQGVGVGKSLAEKDLAATALRIMEKARSRQLRDHPAGRRRRAPIDFAANAPSHAYGLDAIPADGMILDVGPQSIARDPRRHRRRRDAGLERPARRLRDARRSTAARWRPPSMPPSAPRPSKLISVAGGGDTVAALNQAGMWPDNSPTSRPPVAHFLNGWKASPCPASKSCASS